MHAFVIGFVAVIIVATILMTTQALGTGVSFSAFKLTALILGFVFVGAIGSLIMALTSSLPFLAQCLLVFPSVIMMIYSLVVDLGTGGTEK